MAQSLEEKYQAEQTRISQLEDAIQEEVSNSTWEMVEELIELKTK